MVGHVMGSHTVEGIMGESHQCLVSWGVTPVVGVVGCHTSGGACRGEVTPVVGIMGSHTSGGCRGVSHQWWVSWGSHTSGGHHGESHQWWWGVVGSHTSGGAPVFGLVMGSHTSGGLSWGSHISGGVSWGVTPVVGFVMGSHTRGGVSLRSVREVGSGPWWSLGSHSEIGTPLVTLSCTRHYRVSCRTGLPGVSRL